jgi:hypothetical protein
VHRDIGLLDQLRRIRRRMRKETDPDTGGHRDLAAGGVKRRQERIADRGRQGRRRFRSNLLIHDHGKLVATDPAGNTRLTGGVAQALRSFDEDHIPRRVPQNFIDLAETVEIHIEKGDCGT